MEPTAGSALPSGTVGAAEITPQELGLAARNHGMPLEALRYPITPVGLHYLLIHYDIPVVDPGAFRVALGGRVERPLTLSLDDLRARPRVTLPVTMECAGNGRARFSPRYISQPWLTEAVGTGEWTGTPLAPLLEEAGLLPGALEVVFTGLDRGVEGGVRQDYQRALTVEEAMGADVLLAYELNGGPLPPQHGFPLRLVVPGWYGMTNVKWLAGIEVVDQPFAGFQHTAGYRRFAADGTAGAPVTRMDPRSLMVPPGIPDFLTRRRFVEPGPCRLGGRAWSGWAPIERVEVSADGGRSWGQAELDPPLGPRAWRGWSFTWEPEAPGEYELCSRAADAAGNVQPVEAEWNLKGYANTSVERIVVTVGAEPGRAAP
jgi:DMSO/TMAO reductase YedYZ molybdopterin-dependent catalytic subunit